MSGQGERGPTATDAHFVGDRLALLDAFAIAIEEGAPFPVPPGEMLDMAGAFEALVASIESSRPVAVKGRQEYRLAAR